MLSLCVRASPDFHHNVGLCDDIPVILQDLVKCRFRIIDQTNQGKPWDAYL